METSRSSTTLVTTACAKTKRFGSYRGRKIDVSAVCLRWYWNFEIAKAAAMANRPQSVYVARPLPRPGTRHLTPTRCWPELKNRAPAFLNHSLTPCLASLALSSQSKGRAELEQKQSRAECRGPSPASPPTPFLLPMPALLLALPPLPPWLNRAAAATPLHRVLVGHTELAFGSTATPWARRSSSTITPTFTPPSLLVVTKLFRCRCLCVRLARLGLPWSKPRPLAGARGHLDASLPLPRHRRASSGELPCLTGSDLRPRASRRNSTKGRDLTAMS
jgi:hypothetical protein